MNAAVLEKHPANWRKIVGAKHQILLVDDEAGILTLVSIMLRRNGFNVITAKDGPSALDLLETTLPDLIIVDFMMPGMDGIELCRRIRACPDTAAIPLLMLTARNDAETERNARAAGIDEFLSKIIMHHELVARVRSLLDRGMAAR